MRPVTIACTLPSLIRAAVATTAPSLRRSPPRTTIGLTYADRRPSWWPVILLIVAITAARLMYLAFFCPYTLVEDEAWYWEWSRHFEWSYYSKGPGIAWTIAASVALFRQLGIEVSEFVVRFPAVISGAILMFAVAGLTRDAMYHRNMVGGDQESSQESAPARPQYASTTPGHLPLLAAIALLLAPVFQITPFLMTIDIPYMACWALAAWAGWRALRGRSRWAWPALGAAIGIGFLYKYTILLLIPGLVLFAFFGRAHLNLARDWMRWSFASALIFSLALLPVIIWNAQHDWPTVRHLLGHLGLAGGDVQPAHGGGQGWTYSPLWTIEYIGAQFGMIGPLMILMIWGALATIRRRNQGQHSVDRFYLLACSAPILIFYLVVTLLTKAEANWPVAGYITLMPLAVWIVAAARDRTSAQHLPGALPARMAWSLAMIVGVLVAILAARLDLIAESKPLRQLERLAQRGNTIKPGRPLIPLGRLMGADVMAQDVNRLAIELAQRTDLEPFIIAQHYGRASLLAFYMPGHPTVYCASAYDGGRRTQYDLWPHTDLNDLAHLQGRPAILVGGRSTAWERAFEHVDEYGRLRGETKPDRLTYIGINYRGFAPAAPREEDSR